MKTTSISKDHGESRMYEISPADVWHMCATHPYHCDRLGAHAKYYFKTCTIYETRAGGKTIFMREDHADGEKRQGSAGKVNAR